MKTKLIIAGTFLTLIAVAPVFADDNTSTGSTAGKPTPGQIERRGERMEQRMDRPGDRIEQHLDKKGKRIDNRKDRQGERIEHRHDERAQRAR
jgi:hypothetical protein